MIALLAALPSMVFASSEWRGKVIDVNGEPVAYANVVLVSKADSSVVSGGTTSEDGTFNIASENTDVMMMVSMIGYKTVFLEPADDCTVSLEEDTAFLEGAVVSAVMPKTQLTGEGLQTSIRGTALENIGTANDVLARTPGIIKNQDGLQVIGKGSPLVYINGRKVTDSSELDRLQSHEIQSVEVITNPGAQYDASVRSVVRIRTIKRQGEGFGFNTSLTDEQSLRKADNNDPQANADFNYRIKGVDVFAGVHAHRFTHRQDSEIKSETYGFPSYAAEGTLFNDLEQKAVSGNAGLNWQIADTHFAGFKAEYGKTLSMIQHQVVEDRMTCDGAPYDTERTEGHYHHGDIAPHSFSTNVYYNGQTGKLGIDLNLDYYTVGDSQTAEVDERSLQLGGDTMIRTNSSSESNLYASKLVLSYPIWQGQLQVGTEETFSRIDDKYSISGTDIPAASSEVKEDNIAAFASYAFVLNKVGQFNAGLRYEHVNYVFDDLLGESGFDRQYSNAYPSFSYAGAIGKVQLIANYSAKTARPGFAQLSSATRYNSKYIIQSGNPTLQPQKINDAGLTAVWKWLAVVTGYTRTDHAIASWSEPFGGEGMMLVKPRNLDSPTRNLSMFVNATPTIGVWSLNYTAGFQQQWLTIDAPDPREATGIRRTSFSDKPLFIVQAFNTFRLKNDWQLELGGELHSRGYSQNLYISNVYFDLSAAVQKAFLRDKSLIVRLSGADLAGKALTNVSSDFGSVVINQNNMMDTQRVKLSIRYRFNAAQSKYKGTGAGSDVRRRM